MRTPAGGTTGILEELFSRFNSGFVTKLGMAVDNAVFLFLAFALHARKNKARIPKWTYYVANNTERHQVFLNG